MRKIVDLLEGTTDYHCHILPGVDDGVRSMEMALKILSIYEEMGVKEVWLTPHIMEDVPNETADLQARYEALRFARMRGVGGDVREDDCFGKPRNDRVEVHHDDIVDIRTDDIVDTRYNTLSIHLAAEYMLDNLFLERLNADDLLPLGKEGNHILVETSYFNPPYALWNTLDQIKKRGYYPVLAHPERYLYMEKDDYRRLNDMGVKMQLNIFSLNGIYGRRAKKRAQWLLKEKLITYRGSDLHSEKMLNF